MDQFNKTACDHIARTPAWGLTIVEIAGSSFALLTLLFIGHFA